MLSLTTYTALFLSLSAFSSGAALPQSPTPDAGAIPDGYSVGFATQDHEPVNQTSICTTTCPATKNLFATTAGPIPLPANVFAAAINPGLGGASDNCAPCGSCYSIKTSHQPYCAVGESGCKTPPGKSDQGGPDEIKVLITNHCDNCDEVDGHFDVNFAPDGWDNPRIYWKQLDASECH